MDPGWVTAVIALVSVVTGLAVWLGRMGWKLGRRTWQFIADWEGEPASPGHPAQPGVLERLGKLEDGIAGISMQVHLNSGHSMKDVVSRTEAAVEELQKSINAVAAQVQAAQQVQQVQKAGN
jgi:hypothetical protein